MADDTSEPTAPLSARIPEELDEFVRELAKKNGRSITQQLTQMLRDYKTFEAVIARLRVERDYPETQAS